MVIHELFQIAHRKKCTAADFDHDRPPAFVNQVPQCAARHRQRFCSTLVIEQKPDLSLIILLPEVFCCEFVHATNLVAAGLHYVVTGWSPARLERRSRDQQPRERIGRYRL